MRCLFFVIAIVCGTLFAPPLTAAIFQGLGDLPGGFTFSHAQAISSDGRVIIGQSHSAESTDDDDTGEAFRWTAETGMVALGLHLARQRAGLMALSTTATPSLESLTVGTSFGPSMVEIRKR